MCGFSFAAVTILLIAHKTASSCLVVLLCDMVLSSFFSLLSLVSWNDNSTSQNKNQQSSGNLCSKQRNNTVVVFRQRFDNTTKGKRISPWGKVNDSKDVSEAAKLKSSIISDDAMERGKRGKKLCFAFTLQAILQRGKKSAPAVRVNLELRKFSAAHTRELHEICENEKI